MSMTLLLTATLGWSWVVDFIAPGPAPLRRLGHIDDSYSGLGLRIIDHVSEEEQLFTTLCWQGQV